MTCTQPPVKTVNHQTMASLLTRASLLHSKLLLRVSLNQGELNLDHTAMKYTQVNYVAAIIYAIRTTTRITKDTNVVALPT